jgi:hypothetical protein
MKSALSFSVKKMICSTKQEYFPIQQESIVHVIPKRDSFYFVISLSSIEMKGLGTHSD